MEEIKKDDSRVKIPASTERVKNKIDGQNWIVLNLVGPSLNQVMKRPGFRILGAFNKEEEAETYIQQYRKLDDRFDLYKCQMYEFQIIPDQVHDVGEVKYGDNEINNLLDIHHQTKTQTEEWNRRVETAKKGGEDIWGLEGL